MTPFHGLADFTNLGSLYGMTFAFILLVANPLLMLVVMRRAGVRGGQLGLSLLSPVMLVFGGYILPFSMALMAEVDEVKFLTLMIGKSLSVSIGALAPLAILALLKWPVLTDVQHAKGSFE